MRALVKPVSSSFLISIVFFLSACQSQVYQSQELSGNMSANTSLEELESAFWEALSSNCGHEFIGQSTFPDDPQDDFYGKPLKANFETCMDKEIHVPFAVGDNTSRTWIFTRSDNGLQLKHQHLHADGTPDDVTNYGGMGSYGESALVQASANKELSKISLSFPADEFTKNMLPEASTNVWTITLLSNPDNSFSGLTYNLTRHDKPRFNANLNRAEK